TSTTHSTSTSTTSSTSTTHSTSTSTSSTTSSTTSSSTSTSHSTSSSTSSSTTTSTSSTTSTTAFTKLAFTTALGTTSCGPAGLATPPAAPTSGQLFSDTGCSASLTTLGLGCLYFGGGNATVVAGGKIPDAATSFLTISGPGTLSGNAGTSNQNCTL